MKITFCLATAMLLVGCSTEPDPNRLVIRTDFDVSPTWRQRKVGDFEFLPMFRQIYWTAQLRKEAPLAMYSECVDQLDGYNRLKRNDITDGTNAYKGAYARWVRDDEKFRKPYTFQEAFGPSLKSVDAPGREKYPFFIEMSGERPSFFLNKDYPLADRDSYAKWRAAHPNCLGAHTLGEYDQQSMWYGCYVRQNGDKSVMTALTNAFPFTSAKLKLSPRMHGDLKIALFNRDVFPQWVRECFAREQAFFFGETNIWTLCSGCPSLQHIMGEVGACGFSYEATTQGAGSWTVPGAFTRGAARQFGVPFGWYGANFVSAYTRDGKYTAGEHSYGLANAKRYPQFGKDRGASRSLIRRQLEYGWLIGASVIDPENFYTYHMIPEGKDKYAASDFAKDMQGVCDRAKTVARGVSYTPLAVLVPLWDRQGRGYGNRQSCDPWSLNAVCLTLEPPNQEQNEKRLYDLARRNGDESCFFNSPFGGIYDIVAPDATRNRANIQATLGAYKAAIVAGDFRREELPPRVFEDYAAAGGTLFVSADKLAAGIVDPTAAGVEFGKKTVESGKVMFEVRSENEEGRSKGVQSGGADVVDRLKRAASGEATFQSLLKQVSVLSQPYDIMLPSGTPTAKPLYCDENGNVLVWAQNYGKGRIVTVACDRMLPREYAKCPREHIPYTARLCAAARPGFRFDVLHTLLKKVQDETMPVQVEGDVMWGVNKVKGRGEGGQRMAGSSSDGALGDRALPAVGADHRAARNQTIAKSNNSPHWLVWLMNNKGVTKFIGEPEELDASKTATVTVRCGKQKKTVTVAPGTTEYVTFEE